MQRGRDIAPLQCTSSVSHEVVASNGGIFNYPCSHGPLEDRHHEIVEMCVHDVVPSDTEYEADGGSDASRSNIYPIRTMVEVSGEPKVISESQIEHKSKRDSGLFAVVEVDKNSRICRGGGLQLNYHPPNSTCVFLLET